MYGAYVYIEYFKNPDFKEFNCLEFPVSLREKRHVMKSSVRSAGLNRKRELPPSNPLAERGAAPAQCRGCGRGGPSARRGLAVWSTQRQAVRAQGPR